MTTPPPSLAIDGELTPVLAGARDALREQYRDLCDEDAVIMYRREIVSVVPDALVGAPGFSPEALRELARGETAAEERVRWESIVASLVMMDVLQEKETLTAPGGTETP